MGRKVFVSYKYKDNDVKELPNVTQPTWPCDYVDYITGQYPVLHVTSEGLKYAELFTPRIAGNLLKWLETEVDRRLLDEQDI